MSDRPTLPSLDEVIPEQAAELSPDKARALLRRCSEEQRRLAELHDALMIAAFANGGAHRETRDRFVDTDGVGMVGAVANESVCTEQQPDYRLLSVPEAAQYLGFAKSYVYELVRRGEFPAVRHGKYVRIRRSALVRWVAKKESA